jgi:hypothetical protein
LVKKAPGKRLLRKSRHKWEVNNKWILYYTHKLEFYGIAGKANALVKTYLKNRYQRVVINNWHIHSGWGKFNNGVPQRSILGLLLFLLYINDLSNIIISKSKPVLFADDTSIIIMNSSPIDYENNII